MLLLRIAALTCSLALAACVSTAEKVTFVPGPKQQIVPWNEYELLASRQTVTGVGLVHPPGFARTGKWVPFAIEMRNHGKSPIEFRVQDATIVQQGPEGERILPVKTFEEVVAAEKTRQATAEIVLGSLATANVSLAQQTKSGVGQARRERREAMEGLERDNQQNMDFIQQYYLRDHTLMPDVHYKAFLLVYPPEAQSGERNYAIRIKLSDELHELKVVQTTPRD